MIYSLKYDPNGCPNWVSRKGFRYELVISTGNHCLYSQTDEESGTFIGYEVFRIKFQNERVINGTVLKSRFYFPNDEAFGIWAFYASDLANAIDKLISFS